MRYIDIHCHLDFPDYGTELSEVLTRMKEREVGAITIGTDLESSKRAVKIAEENENVWACIGAHPEETEFNEVLFEKLVVNERVVAIGECGLDFFRLKPEELERERERQTILFKQQIEFALKYNKPLMLHCRDAQLTEQTQLFGRAYEDTLEILDSYKREAGDKLRGNAHFFAGTVEQAKRFFDLGFTISFTGVITFPPRRNSAETGADPYQVIKEAPLDKIMSETDSPFVAPEPYRGRRNEPVFVVEVVRKIAEIKEEDEEKLSSIMVNNAKKLFGIK